jgi:chemotaxis protein MotB
LFPIITKKNNSLTKENDVKLYIACNTATIYNKILERMNETLAKVDQNLLANAKTLKDSLNLAIGYSLKKSMDSSELENSDDVINININQIVVMIFVSDKLLFNTAS